MNEGRNVVLVHGASGFRGLYDELLGEDITVIAPPNPLRGLTGGAGGAEYRHEAARGRVLPQPNLNLQTQEIDG